MAGGQLASLTPIKETFSILGRMGMTGMYGGSIRIGASNWSLGLTPQVYT